MVFLRRRLGNAIVLLLNEEFFTKINNIIEQMNITRYIPIIILLTFPPGNLHADSSLEVFAIRSNLIKSWIQYSVKYSTDNGFPGKEPVFFFLKRPSGSTRKPGYFENRYYGIKTQNIQNNTSVEITIEAFPSKKIIIELKNGKAIPYTIISNKRCVLTEIIIHANKRLFSSYTGYADIIGVDIETKDQVYERIYKDRS